MDPNANLQEMRRIVARAIDGNTGEPLPGDHDRLIDLVEALDQWLQKGGALPDHWEQNRSKLRDEDGSAATDLLSGLALIACCVGLVFFVGLL